MKKLKLMKTLFVAVGLLLGTSAWADVEITETYDFASFITANNAGNLTISGDEIAQSGTSAKVGTVKVIDNLIVNAKTLELNGRFAVDYQYDAGSQIRFMWRSSANNYQHGLAGNWNNKGTADPQGAARFSVLNLKAGDKITFTYFKQTGKAADPYTCSASQLSGVAVDAALSSGTEYTVAADGNVDLYFTNNNFAIASIVIKTTGTETVSAPSIAVTGCDAKARIVTITAGTSDAGNDVTTYYTIDGSTPTTSSASFTTASKEITVGESATEESTITVKAFSVSSSTAESAAASQDVTVGTLVQLAKPSIYLSSFASAVRFGYNPVYSFTSDQSVVLGNPSVTYSYSFAGGASTAGSSYTATTSGSITVTVSAEGYASNSTVESIVGGNYLKTYSFDAINDVTVDTSTGEWGNPTGVNGAQWTFTSLTNCTYTLRADISLTGFSYARATTAQTKQGFYTRLGAGSIGFDLESGECIAFGMRDGSKVIANSEATSQAFAQWNNVRSIEIYTPATEVDLAILDCKQYDTSSAFATAIDAGSFASAEEVYAFNTTYHITNGVLTDGVRDITGVIRNAAIADGTDWGGSSINHGEQYTGAPDEYYIDKYNGSINANQTIYGVPAGTYKIKAATRSAEDTSGTLYVNDGTGDIAKVNQITSVGNTGGDLGNGWSWSEMTFTLTETKNLLIGIWADASSKKWAGCDDWHIYRIESASKNITSAGWATYCSPYALDFSSSIVNLTNAYIVTGATDNTLNLTPITGTVPAETGILLEGEGDVVIPVATSSSFNVSANKLVGKTEEYSLAANGGYVLLNGANGVGFYINPNSAFTVGANTAYLPVDFADARAFYLFDEDATGINAVSTTKAETGDYYNLAGQRVAQPTKGLYIVNGKKYVVK